MKVEDFNLIKPRSLHKISTIRDAFSILNGAFGMIVTVLEDDKSLCGIVTEGDLRRALLAGHSLNSPLDEVMNQEPITIGEEDLEKGVEFSDLANRWGFGRGSILSKVMTIPVLDNDKKVIGLVTLEMLKALSESRPDSKFLKALPQVLVVGGAGYIGSVLVRLLLDNDFRVRVLDNMIYRQQSLKGIQNNDRLSIHYGDATNIGDLVEAVKGIDAVVYLAEIVGDPACAYAPDTALKSNYLAVSAMANLCSHLNINRFVYTSSCSIYGASADPDILLDEESSVNPRSHYGRMKLMAEHEILGQSNPLFSPTILRLATVFGYSYRPRFDLVVNTFAKNAYFHRAINTFGGNQWRPNVHVADVGGNIITVLKSPLEMVKRQVFNVGSNSENHTINDLAELTQRVFPECKIIRNDKVVDPRNYRVNFDKIKSILKFKTRFTVLDGLRELRDVFERSEITDPDNEKYSNIEALKEYQIENSA